MKHIGMNEEYIAIQPECNEQLDEGVFWANSERTKLSTPTNIAGYYLRMIKSYILSFDELSKIAVKPSINKELEEKFAEPIIVVQRGVLQPHNVGIMNNNRLENVPSIGLNEFQEKQPEANYYESKMYSEFVNMGMEVDIYGYTPAEVEKISVLVYNLILAASYDVLAGSFKFIIGGTPPTLSPVGITEKHSEVYTSQIAWSIDYKDDSILLIRKNVIKYATIIAREDTTERRVVKTST